MVCIVCPGLISVEDDFVVKLIPLAASEPPRIISDLGVNNSPDGSSSGTPAKAEEKGIVVVVVVVVTAASSIVCRT